MVTRYEEKIIERDGVLHDCEFGKLVCSNQNRTVVYIEVNHET